VVNGGINSKRAGQGNEALVPELMGRKKEKGGPAPPEPPGKAPGNGRALIKRFVGGEKRRTLTRREGILEGCGEAPG